jgi:hypothetical protein
MQQNGIEGRYLCKEIITYYNTNTKEVYNKNNEFLLTLKQLNEFELLGTHIFLIKSDSTITSDNVDILFFKDSTGWTSGSYPNGINRLFYSDDELIYNWSDEINSDGILTNARIKLLKIY